MGLEAVENVELVRLGDPTNSAGAGAVSVTWQ